ncbi:MAG TPA: hypothetical protein VM264_06885 [Acidimicrobiales bacterium]|nr:hypothetical protein [Acidimicrobiales bacterium]
MFAFFIILALLMVLVVAAGSWSSGAWGGRGGRRVIYDRTPVERRPRSVVSSTRGEEVIEEEWEDTGTRPRSRRVVRRREF